MSIQQDESLRRFRHESDTQYVDRFAAFKLLSKEYPEEAETLSMAYSNMKYMHCRYPPDVESKLMCIPGMAELTTTSTSKARVDAVLSKNTGR